MADYDFSSKNVLITGAAGGIGEGLVAAFAGWGAQVLAVDRDPTGLERLAAANPGILTGEADLTDRSSTQAAINKLVAQTGHVDVLVNNVGAAAATALANLSPEAWEHDLAINLSSAYHCVEAVKRAMLDRGAGVIVNIGSVNALLALGHPAYSAAKAGLVSYTRSLALEYGPKGIRVNLIAPGTVRTQAWEARAAKNPQIFEQLRKWYPLRDFAKPQDIANATAFLASDQARMITGVVLPVDAGLTCGNSVLAAELTLEQF
jgi:NAD(P)-dependent dehydrogenase (short-subunit alcohol dehydrogenase family)